MSTAGGAAGVAGLDTRAESRRLTRARAARAFSSHWATRRETSATDFYTASMTASDEPPASPSVETFILEGVVTTVDLAGAVNVAPMGPTVRLIDGEVDWTQLTLRPFDSSRTYRNLAEQPEGVFHVVDDVLLLARAAVGSVSPELVPSQTVSAPRLADCCRYYEFRIVDKAGERPRETLAASVTQTGRVRDYVGLHRARHAVLEAAIVSTRVHLLDAAVIEDEFTQLRPLVAKTATTRERQAWNLLVEHCKLSETIVV